MSNALRIQVPTAQTPPAANQEDRIGRDDRSALVCCHEPAYLEFLTTQLRTAGYKVHHAGTHQQGAQRLAGRAYHLTVLLENLEGCSLDTNGLLRQFSTMGTDERRGNLVVLLCQSYATGDELSAYALSVDLLINYTDVAQFNALVAPMVEERQEGDRHFAAVLGKAA